MTWELHRLESPAAVDKLFAPDLTDQPLRLSDIAFVPPFEAKVLNWMQQASLAPVEIAKPTEKPDYLDRLPVRIRSMHDTSSPTWQQMLLSQGLALLMPETGHDMTRLIAAEDRAITDNVGIWNNHDADGAYYVVSGDANSSLWGRNDLPDVKDAIGRFVVVDAVLVSIEHQEWRSYLNFGQDWRRDFTIAIGADMRDVLTDSDTTLDQWIGHRVRVRGVIENRGGPYIALQNINWLCVNAQ